MWEIHRKELARLSRVAERFLSFARPSPSALVPLDLRRVAEQLALLTEAEARHRQHVRLALETADAPVTVRGDVDQLASLALHIAVNAFKKASPPTGGTLRIAVASEPEAALPPSRTTARRCPRPTAPACSTRSTATTRPAPASACRSPPASPSSTAAASPPRTPASASASPSACRACTIKREQPGAPAVYTGSSPQIT
jgi:hypothetical protein